MRDRAGALILVGVFLFAGLTFGVGMLASTPGGTSRSLTLQLVLATVAGVLFGAAAVWLVSRSWRSHGGRTAVAERSGAVQQGQLPESADENWLPGLRARRQNARQLPWLLPILVALTVALGLTHLHDSSALPSTYWFVFAGVLLVMAIFRIARRSRDLLVLERFIEQLERGENVPLPASSEIN